MMRKWKTEWENQTVPVRYRCEGGLPIEMNFKWFVVRWLAAYTYTWCYFKIYRTYHKITKNCEPEKWKFLPESIVNRIRKKRTPIRFTLFEFRDLYQYFIPFGRLKWIFYFGAKSLVPTTIVGFWSFSALFLLISHVCVEPHLIMCLDYLFFFVVFFLFPSLDKYNLIPFSVSSAPIRVFRLKNLFAKPTTQKKCQAEIKDE